jgi:hypothetical protein
LVEVVVVVVEVEVVCSLLVEEVVVGAGTSCSRMERLSPTHQVP